MRLRIAHGSIEELESLIPVGLGGGLRSIVGRLRAVLFSLRNEYSLPPEVGTHSSLTVGAGSIINSDGNLQLLPANVPKFEGARTVVNLLSLSSAPATQTLTAQVAGKYVLRIGGGGTVSASGATDGSYGSLTTTASEVRALAFTLTVAQNITITVTTAPANFQLENTTSHTDKSIPSEYVSAGVGVGSEQITNGSNFTDTVGWSKPRSTATLSAVGGNLRVTSNATTNTFGAAYQIDNLHIGEDYKFDLSVLEGTATAATIIVRYDTSSSLSSTTGQVPLTTDGTAEISFAATASTIYFGVIVTGHTAGDYIDVTNASVKSLAHNANKDGVKVFSTANGNTVAAGVVTEAVGAALTTMVGQLYEPERTNIFLQSLAPATQNITVTAVAHTLSIVGAGSIALSGVGTGTATAASPLTFTPTAGILTLTVTAPVTSAQLEIGLNKTTHITTTTAAVTRLRNDHKVVWPVGKVNNVKLSGILRLPYANTATTIVLFCGYVDASNYVALMHDGTNAIVRKRIAGVNYDATKALTIVIGTEYTIEGTFHSVNGVGIKVNSVVGTSHANTTNFTEPTRLQEGSLDGTLNHINGNGHTYLVENI